MKRSIITSLILSLLVAVFTVGFSQPQRPNYPLDGGEKYLRGLGLNPEQQNKIAQYRLELQKQNLPLRAKLNDYYAQLKLLVISDQFNEERAKSILQQIGGIRQQLALNRLLFQREVRKLLTPEQRVKFDMRLLSHGKKHPHPKVSHQFQRHPKR